MNDEIARQASGIGFWVDMVLLTACMGLVVIGPHNADRALALDLAIVLIAVGLSLFSATNGTSVYMDAALVLSIISFLVTVLLSRLLLPGAERRS